MKQNIYDNPVFFQGYQNLRSEEKGLNVVLEEPAFRSLLPELAGKVILDLGCGFGKFAAWAVSAGAAEVTGVDISEKMLHEARRGVDRPNVRFVHEAVEDYAIPESRFDLIVSSLCFHYVQDICPVFRRIHRGLKANGRFVFSVEHPICTSLLQGWERDASGRRRHWPVDRYREEGLRVSRWFVDGVIKYHRTVETYVNTLIDAGFSIRRLLEPEAKPEFLARRPDLLDDARRPPFLLLAADK
jgi:SAM-dependent methyltransferase